MMKEDTKYLVRFSTYAKLFDVSVTAVANWVKSGRIKAVEIDGVKFVDTRGDLRYEDWVKQKALGL